MLRIQPTHPPPPAHRNRAISNQSATRASIAARHQQPEFLAGSYSFSPDFIFFANRQRKDHTCSFAAAARVDPDSSLVRFYDSLRDREAHSGSCRLACANVAIARGAKELVKHSLT